MFPFLSLFFFVSEWSNVFLAKTNLRFWYKLYRLNPLMHNVPKWSDTLNILQQMQQDF